MVITQDYLINACTQVVEEMRPTSWIPNPATRYKPGGSTGNMAFNSCRYKLDGDTFIVYIDEAIAPYFPYTEYPWISPKWHVREKRKNPNEGWVERYQDEYARELCAKLGGADRV